MSGTFTCVNASVACLVVNLVSTSFLFEFMYLIYCICMHVHMCTCVSMVHIYVWVFACVCMFVCMYYMCTVKRVNQDPGKEGHLHNPHI